MIKESTIIWIWEVGVMLGPTINNHALPANDTLTCKVKQELMSLRMDFTYDQGQAVSGTHKECP